MADDVGLGGLGPFLDRNGVGADGVNAGLCQSNRHRYGCRRGVARRATGRTAGLGADAAA